MLEILPLAALPNIGELIGVVLAAYGLLRESFATLAKQRPYGEGRYGEGTYGGPGRIARFFVRLGIGVRLLPGDRELTLSDRYRNAACTIIGVILVIISIIADICFTLAQSP